MAVLVLLVAHCWRNNTMMAYVEKNMHANYFQKEIIVVI